MKKNLRAKSGGFSPRLLLAFGLFLISGVLALFAFTESPSTNIAKRSPTSFSPMWSVPLDPKLGHSYWNELIISATRGIPNFGQPAVAQRSFAMKAAGGRTNRHLSQNKTLVPFVSNAVTPAVSLPFRNLPSANPFSAWVEQPEPRRPS